MPLGPERPGQHEVVADDRAADEVDERVALRRRRREVRERVQQLGGLRVIGRGGAGAGCSAAIRARARSSRPCAATRFAMIASSNRSDTSEPASPSNDVRGQLEQDGVLQRGARRAARAAIHERDLAEHLPGPEHGEPVAPRAPRHRDLDRARGDDEERPARRAGLEDDGTGGHAALGHVLQHTRQVIARRSPRRTRSRAAGRAVRVPPAGRRRPRRRPRPRPPHRGRDRRRPRR